MTDSCLYDMMDSMSILKLARPRARHRALAAGLAASICLTLASVAASSADSHAGPTSSADSHAGRTARVVAVNDTAHMTLTNPSSASATLVEEGRALGSLPGTVRVRLTVGTSTVTAGFTIYLQGGTISGHGYAKLNPGRGEYASFGGSLAVSHGSGHYAHASGSGGLFGTINRTTDNATVQVVGNLHL
jgi:hypothetical protein